MNIRSSLMAAMLLMLVPFSPAQAQGAVPPSLEARLKSFFVQKQAQARALLKEEGQETAPEVWKFFNAGAEGDWKTVGSSYRLLRSGAYQYDVARKDKRLETMAWQPVNECFGAYDEFSHWPEDYMQMFGNEIAASIPKGSLYFGGTDPGRWVLTAFCKSHANADPFFVLTQNALADGLYLKYLRVMYGTRIKIASEEESQTAFSNYVAEASQRLKAGKLQPGEKAKEVNGKVQVSGQYAVMQVNARIARKIFDSNPDREFYVEESFPLDWMYPYLSPNGFIMKINREPVAELSAGTLRKDREYWMRFSDRAIGQWLTPETPVKDVCDFAATVFGARENGDYQPDERFVRNSYACKSCSKLRSSIAGVYAWRVTKSKTPAEKTRMIKEADFAFRQAFALCPYSSEAVFRYANFLVEQGRKKEALLVAQTAEPLDPRNTGLANLLQQLESQQ